MRSVIRGTEQSFWNEMEVMPELMFPFKPTLRLFSKFKFSKAKKIRMYLGDEPLPCMPTLPQYESWQLICIGIAKH